MLQYVFDDSFADDPPDELMDVADATRQLIAELRLQWYASPLKHDALTETYETVKHTVESLYSVYRRIA